MVSHTLIENTADNRSLLQSKYRCDKYDYLAAIACGAIGAIVDIFMVEIPVTVHWENSRMNRQKNWWRTLLGKQVGNHWPVFLTDLSIRLIWSIRRYFQYGKDLEDCIPLGSHEDLRVMLLMGNGTLCVMDGMDAWVRSGGTFLTFLCVWIWLHGAGLLHLS